MALLQKRPISGSNDRKDCWVETWGAGVKTQKKKVICTIINKEKWVSSGGVFCTGTNLYQLCIDHQTSIFVDPSPPRLPSTEREREKERESERERARERERECVCERERGRVRAFLFVCVCVCVCVRVCV